jgi:hypothetical protein
MATQYTDAYNVAIQWLKEQPQEPTPQEQETIDLVKALVGQYYYGTEPQKELTEQLQKMNLL